MSRVTSLLLRATDPGAWFKFRNANREMIPTPQRRDMFQGKRRVFENNVKTMKRPGKLIKGANYLNNVIENDNE